MHIAHWNMHTILDRGEQCSSMRTFYDYGIAIACLFEVRLPKSGSRHIRVRQMGASYWVIIVGRKTSWDFTVLPLR